MPQSLTAERTSKPEVGLIIATTPGDRDDMLDYQARHYEVLRAETIATAVT